MANEAFWLNWMRDPCIVYISRVYKNKFIKNETVSNTVQVNVMLYNSQVGEYSALVAIVLQIIEGNSVPDCAFCNGV